MPRGIWNLLEQDYPIHHNYHEQLLLSPHCFQKAPAADVENSGSEVKRRPFVPMVLVSNPVILALGVFHTNGASTG